MEQNIKINYNGLDIGKFLCAFLILFYHYFSEHGSLPGLLDEALSLYAVAVALFMSISGFLIFNKLNNVKNTKERWKIVKKQAIRIYSIYLLWSIPYLIFSISKWDWQTVDISFVLGELQRWVFQSTFYTIWFMPMLAIGLIVTFWLTEKLPPYLVNILAIICYAVGALILTYSFVGEKMYEFNIFAEFANTWLGGARGWLFYAFPLILVGKHMVDYKDRMKPLPMVGASCCCILGMLAEALLIRKISGEHTGIDLTVMMLPTVFCILGFLISIRLPDGKYAKWMRSMSILIFMSQRIFLTVLPSIFPHIFYRINSNKYLGAVIVAAFVVGFSQIIIFISKKSNIARRLF